MFTLFAVPKPFAGHVGIIQRNACESWAHLRLSCEIILFGDEDGTAEVARELGVQHVPTVARNEHGTPLISDLFAAAAGRARHDVLVYANADMILLDDLVHAVARVRHLPRFLLCGQRRNLQIDDRLQFAPGWAERLRATALLHGHLAIPGAIDYFAFPRDLYTTVPPFAIGRAEWDQWMLFRARALNAPLIDATAAVLAIHQEHDYAHLGHLPSGAAQAEIDHNRELAQYHRLDLRAATHLLTPTHLRPALTPAHLVRRACSLPKFYLPPLPLVRTLYGFWRRQVRGLGAAPA